MLHYEITTRSTDRDDETVYMEEVISSFDLSETHIGKGAILPADGSDYPDRRIVSIILRRD